MDESLSGRTVLVVDDTTVPRVLVSDMLRQAGMEVLETDAGEPALKIAGEKRIDAFLLDVRLPDMNGIELCRALRAMERYRATPIIFVSALDQRELLQWALESGCDDFIQKPIHAMVLRKRLANLLQKAEYLAQAEKMGASLRRYVSPRAEESARHFATTQLLSPPRQEEACVLFCDTRGMTETGSVPQPAQLFARLSRYFEAQGNLVYARGGYIDRFSSDGILAVFGGGAAATLECCLCAVDILDLSREMAAGEAAERFGVGIGIHRGPVVSGNLGTHDHLDYTIVGETVNLAARLCGTAEQSIVVTRAVREILGDAPELAFSAPREVSVRGTRGPVTVHDMERASA
ncbi:MAG TPA: response regulator [Burkholderiales bacterium]|nr:response regulator [Burkholderiales bacterium]